MSCQNRMLSWTTAAGPGEGVFVGILVQKTRFTQGNPHLRQMTMNLLLERRGREQQNRNQAMNLLCQQSQQVECRLH